MIPSLSQSQANFAVLGDAGQNSAIYLDSSAFHKLLCNLKFKHLNRPYVFNCLRTIQESSIHIMQLLLARQDCASMSIFLTLSAKSFNQRFLSQTIPYIEGFSLKSLLFLESPVEFLAQGYA